MPDVSELSQLLYWLHPLSLIHNCKGLAHVAMSYIVRLFSGESNRVANHDAMVNRLQKMKETFQEKEKRLRLDPFQRTFLEKSREYFSYGFGNRENSLKVKLRLFAGSAWCREHADPLIEQAIKVRHNVITAFDFDTPEVLDNNWVPMIFSSAESKDDLSDNVAIPAIESPLGEQVALDEQLTPQEEFHPLEIFSPPSYPALQPLAVAHEGCSVSDLFLSAQRYFVDANLFGKDRISFASFQSKSAEDGFDDLNMAFSQEDMALFKAAIDGSPLKFA